MEIQLICSKHNRPILENLLLSRGLIVSRDSAIVFVEKGFSVPEGVLCLVFDAEKPAALLDFLTQASELRDKSSLSSGPEQDNILLGRNGECFEVLKVPEIFYFRAEGDYVFCSHTKGSFEIKKKLYHLEDQFSSQGFFRINKSEIVNIMKIAEVVPWFGGRLLLRLDSIKETLEVSRNYVKSFKGFLGM